MGKPEYDMKQKVFDDAVYGSSIEHDAIRTYRLDTIRMAEIWRPEDLAEYVLLSKEYVNLSDKPLVVERLEIFKKASPRKVAAELGDYLV